MTGNRHDGSPRVTMLAAGASGFAVLFAGAELFGFDASIMGINDKALRPLAHVVVYGLLAVLLVKGLGNRYFLAGLLSLTLATVEETRQIWIDGRYASVLDATLNATGIISFLAVSWLLDHYVGYLRQRRRYRRVLVAENAWRPMQTPSLGQLVRVRRSGMGWLTRTARASSLILGIRINRSGAEQRPDMNTAPA